MAIVKSGKGKMAECKGQDIKDLYREAIEGSETFAWAAPGSYDRDDILSLYDERKLYRPLAKSFGLV